MMPLKDKHCEPCKGGFDPMSNQKEDEMIQNVNGWTLDRDGDHRIKKTFKFDDFKQAMLFVNEMAGIADEEGHHPDFSVSYSKVDVSLMTHKIGGLHENDFILASKINEIERK